MERCLHKHRKANIFTWAPLYTSDVLCFVCIEALCGFLFTFKAWTSHNCVVSFFLQLVFFLPNLILFMFFLPNFNLFMLFLFGSTLFMVFLINYTWRMYFYFSPLFTFFILALLAFFLFGSTLLVLFLPNFACHSFKYMLVFPILFTFFLSNLSLLYMHSLGLPFTLCKYQV